MVIVSMLRKTMCVFFLKKKVKVHSHMPNKYIMVLPVAVGEKQLSIKNVPSFKSKYFAEI